MDGGGRFPEPPIAAGPAGGAAGSAPAAAPAGRGLPGDLSRYLPRFLRPRRASVAIPAEQRLPHLVGTSLVFGFFGLVGAAGFVASGAYAEMVARSGTPLDIVARAAGFGLDKVTIAGLVQLQPAEILHAAGIDRRNSLPFLNVVAVRDRLAEVPLIGSVSVRKIYPHELVVTLAEREPSALWQRNGEISVISADGTVIDRMRDGRFATLPLVVGDEANLRTKEYLDLLDAAGPLRERIRAGTLVSGRRWTLKLDGIDVRLPESGAREAMARLVRIEAESRLLEKDIIAVDLRMPDRVVVRLTEEGAAARQEAMRKKPKAKGTET
ncbi:Polypeptide-transport-associated domain protein FtsQ-type [Methylobacterium sp. 4-46]|uniref:cell division protein FtsQ/DivIB n=1 Tax=unclassified Methylobacterium TaxID=2615210 RepID=UPI000152E234|nr:MULTISPECIES: cell division protein FtsQ/DivIB [Methylobacterium]ACA20950.1 Polypeptide-transport-associated domain protein FtsQ-type [Methylobacterium sp. 4-46]WFT80105.1 cell division protein FtsQ/DivIB [Methylobacterium nodulans]